jgi:small subunit ribosomal protein S7
MRRKRVYKKDHKPDAVHESIAVGRFINYLMQDGKKSVAEKVMYDAMDIIKEKTKKEPMGVFEQALENVTPEMEVKSRRIGGANYQIPIEVRPDRKFFLASGWIIEAARVKKGGKMAERLAEEIIAASSNEGDAVKKKQNVHRMAEANRAFAHFARR